MPPIHRRVTDVASAKPSRNGRILPTDRISFPKQLDLLRAYAVASGPEKRPVTNNDVAPIVKMTSSTVSISNAFFADIGFLQRLNGGYIPSQEVVSFTHAHGWNPENAPQKLAPLLESSWFGQAILRKARFRTLTEEEAIQDLSEEASASPEKKPQLQILLLFLQAAGLIVQEGGQIRTARNAPAPPNGEKLAAPLPDSPIDNGSNDQESVVQKSYPPVATSFLVPTEGTVRFNVSVCVDMAEFKGWEPDNISKFFAGIAQVLAAKAAVERSSKPS